VEVIKKLSPFLKVNIFGAIISFSMIAAAISIQLIYQLEPCPLCITQRIIFIAIAFIYVFFIFIKHNKWSRFFHFFTLVSASIVGLIFSGRHILIQQKWISIPAECGIDLDYMFENFPLSQAISLVFKGTGDCSSIDWDFLGFTLPQLAFLGYLFIMVLTVITFLKIKTIEHA